MEETINKEKDCVVDWVASGSTNAERFDLLRRIFDVVPEEELNGIIRIINNAKKRRKRTNRPVDLVQETGSVRVPEQPVRVPEEEDRVTVPLINSSGDDEPVNFLKNQIFSMDVEKMEMYGEVRNGKQRYDQKAGSVAVVNSSGEVIYHAKIFREFRSYRTTAISFEKNGFTTRSLQEHGCKNIHVVKRELYRILSENLIVGIEIVKDLESLDLPTGDFNIYDLQWHWWRWNEVQNSREKLGLRSLCFHFFKEDVQPEGKFHTPDNDAIWTMKLFNDVFCKLVPKPMTRFNIDSSNHIIHYKG